MRLAFLIIALFPYLFGFSQTIRIEGEKGVEDEQFAKSQSIVPIYKYTSRFIEPYTRFGIESDPDEEWYEIKRLPDMSECRDTAYTYIYFAGADNKRSQGYILTLVGNYFRSPRTVFFWIDRNNDLDFTNDGPPDSLTFAETEFVIELHNQKDSNATYAVKLSRFSYGENVRYKRLLNKHYQNHSGKKQFTSVNFCYREQRYNSIVFNHRSGEDSFSLALKDMNVDGFYNEAEVDMFTVGPLGSIPQLDDLREISKKNKENQFQWNGKEYQIRAIDPAGRFVEIELMESSIGNVGLKWGKSTPDFEYYNILNKPHKLSEYKHSEVYIYFWTIDRLSQEDTSYLGKINREFKDRIQLITLNHGDLPRKVRMTYFYDRLDFPVGYSSSDIAEAYFMEDAPRGYYLGKKCVLKDDNVDPKALYELLSTEGLDP